MSPFSPPVSVPSLPLISKYYRLSRQAPGLLSNKRSPASHHFSSHCCPETFLRVIYLMEMTRDSTSSRMAMMNTTTAAGGGGDATIPCFRKHVMESMRKTVVERNTSRSELKVALANVFTGAFLITCVGYRVKNESTLFC